MKRLKVDLEYIAICMDDQDRLDQNYFLDMESGETVMLPREVIDALDDEELLDSLPKWELKLVDLARDILGGNPRYIEIPPKKRKEGFNDILEFAERINDQNIREKILVPLHGKGIWRKFKEILQETPEIEKEWLRFKNEKEKKEVLAWLASIGIEPITEEEGGQSQINL
ncbi:MAG: UPF0158 family protein [Thermodesulfobacteriota bacterium]